VFPLPAYFKNILFHTSSHSVHTNVGSDVHVITWIKIERFWLVNVCKKRVEGKATERTRLLVPTNGTFSRGLRIAKVIISYMRVNAAGVAQSA
jgi:hypothetical protein